MRAVLIPMTDVLVGEGDWGQTQGHSHVTVEAEAGMTIWARRGREDSPGA